MSGIRCSIASGPGLTVSGVKNEWMDGKGSGAASPEDCRDLWTCCMAAFGKSAGWQALHGFHVMSWNPVKDLDCSVRWMLCLANASGKLDVYE